MRAPAGATDAPAQPPLRRRREAAGGARAGGGPRFADLVTCCDCQSRFRLYVADANWYKDKGLTPATRCKHCRQYRQARACRRRFAQAYARVYSRALDRTTRGSWRRAAGTTQTRCSELPTAQSHTASCATPTWRRASPS